jgi:LPXTG-motif cell wall-anchored protein
MPKTGGGMPSWAWAAIAAVVAVAIYLGSKG